MRAASLRPAGVRARAGLRSALAVAALMAATGCAHTSPDAAASNSPSSAAPVPSPSATTVDEKAALLAQYRKFWASLTPVSRMAATSRRAVLARLAVDPELKSVLHGLDQADLKGQVLYGANVPRPTVRVNPQATTALVDDCQDSSHAGVAVKASGERVTVGSARNHVSVTMKKQPDGLWKVAFVAYSKAPC